MLTQNLGYPRIGSRRELKKACENYWSGKIPLEKLIKTAQDIRLTNWQLHKQLGIDLIPSNDFSYYDQVLDMTLAVGAIPKRYTSLATDPSFEDLDLYFAMARGYQQGDKDVTAMEMTKWFDTNYHYIVPEFTVDQTFKLYSNKALEEYQEAKSAGIQTKPVLIGPVSFLLVGKEKEPGFHRIELLQSLLPVYQELIQQLYDEGAEWIQLDEPILSMDLDPNIRKAYQYAYSELAQSFPALKIIMATYFDGLRDNLSVATSLPVSALHIDLVRYPHQLEEVLKALQSQEMYLSLGIIDGRNIWKNDFQQSLEIINRAVDQLDNERIMIAPSCSLLHSPCDLDLETHEAVLTPEIKQWLSFAKQKLEEIATLKQLVSPKEHKEALQRLTINQISIESRNHSPMIHKQAVKASVNSIKETDTRRNQPFSYRKSQQRESLGLPDFPTTTIGSFPQTKEVRKWRSKYKKGELTPERYKQFLEQETEKAIKWQEEIGLDVLVHGEFERNDMVEYFGEQLEGFVFTQNGWVQSYGSRCVKPPIIYGDIHRPKAMTVEWSSYAQSLTSKWVKGMLTGPVTILQWSFVRDDQPRSQTCTQVALAIRDEVNDLEKAGIRIIQIDEPAIREGLPLRKEDWQDYLQWAIKAFRIASTGVRDDTQIHTHMCYSEFNDIIEYIADMDADVITIECSRSQMELLDAFAEFKYPNEIGPGIYDIHSPRVPAKAEMVGLLEKAKSVLSSDQIWVNPDCGLKTRDWKETRAALTEMVEAAKELRLHA